MLLRELKINDFEVWEVDVRVRHRTYSQAIKVKISARNMQEARRLAAAQYGKDSTIIAVRRAK